MIVHDRVLCKCELDGMATLRHGGITKVINPKCALHSHLHPESRPEGCIKLVDTSSKVMKLIRYIR